MYLYFFILLQTLFLIAEERAYVANWEADNISVIQTSNNTVVETISTDTGPIGLAFTPDHEYVYVTNYGSAACNNKVTVIQTSDNTILTTITVGNCPAQIAITPNGLYGYVANYFSDSFSVIEISSNTVVATVTTGDGPMGVTITPDGQYAYFALEQAGSVQVVQTSDNTIVATIGVGSSPYRIAITPNGDYAYVTNRFSDNVSVIQTSNNTVIATIGVGDWPHGIAITPDGEFAYVVNFFMSNNVSVIQISTNTVENTIAVGSWPKAIAFTPDGEYAYVTNGGGNSISVIEISSGTVVETIPVNTNPSGIIIGNCPEGPGWIEGTVSLEGGTGNVEEVIVTAGTESTNPDSSGFYSIEIEPGTYNVTASLEGYFNDTVHDVGVEEGQITGNIDLSLQWIFPPPQNVQVTWTALLTWEPPDTSSTEISRELTGYNLYLDGCFQDFTTDLFYQFTGLIYGQQATLGVSAVYDDPGESEIVEVIFWGFPPPPPPENLVATVFDYNDVHLEWEMPGTGDVLAHHSGYDYNGIGTGLATDWMCAARFTEDELVNYYYQEIINIRIHIRTADFNYVAVKIWEGGSFGDPGTEIYSADITNSVHIESWTTHTLTPPITIEPGNEYWIGYDISATGDHPSSVDAGPAVAGKGDWMFYEGIWQEISVAFNLDYNWCIEGVVDVGDDLPMHKPVVQNTRQMISNGTPEILNIHPRNGKIENSRINRNLLGFKVYRDEIEIAEILDPLEMTYDDYALDNGTYEYKVTAIYYIGESYPSNVEEATVILYSPINLTATMQGNYIFITWDPPGPLSGRNLDYYNIYINGEFIETVTSIFYLIVSPPPSTFEFGVSAVYDGGWESPIASIIVILDVGDLPIPLVTELIGNYPNPFNPTTTISFNLYAEDAKDAKIEIFNLKGQKVKVFTFPNGSLGTSEHSVVWDGKDKNGKPVSSGIYFYKMRAGKFTSTKKMILLK